MTVSPTARPGLGHAAADGDPLVSGPRRRHGRVDRAPGGRVLSGVDDSEPGPGRLGQVSGAQQSVPPFSAPIQCLPHAAPPTPTPPPSVPIQCQPHSVSPFSVPTHPVSPFSANHTQCPHSVPPHHTPSVPIQCAPHLVPTAHHSSAAFSAPTPLLPCPGTGWWTTPGWRSGSGRARAPPPRFSGRTRRPT